MTRRAAILSLLSIPEVATGQAFSLGPLKPTSLTWHLDRFTDYRIVFNGETVTLTAKDIFEALKG